jgi:hypothetical protein
MAIEQFSLTLDGTCQDLFSALNLLFPQDDWAFATLSFQADAANQGDIYIGVSTRVTGLPAAGFVTSSRYGVRLSAADPYRRPVVLPSAGGSALRLSDFAVLGTAGDRLYILGIGR